MVVATGPNPPDANFAQRAVSGAKALALRQVLVQALNALAVVALARLLSPADFGVYTIIMFAQGLLSRFGDAGLGASLLRQREAPSTRDYRVIFTFQQLIVGGVIAIFALVVPLIVRARHLPDAHVTTLQLVGLGFFFTGFRAIPTLKLERELAFEQLAVVDVAEALVYNGLAVGLAYAGFGSQSIALAILARSLLGALVIQGLAPFRFGWVWDLPYVRSHLSFGLSFQAIGIVSLLKDSITPVLIGLWLGPADVGYVTWAQSMAAYALLVLAAFHRFYLPLFARLQDDLAALSSIVTRTIWSTNAVVAPLAVCSLALFEPLTTLVFGAKWLVAKPLFLWLAAANLFVPTVTPLLGLFNALGRSQLALSYAVLWMVATWLFGVPLIVAYGAIGYALANVLVQLTNLALFRSAKRLVPLAITATLWRLWLAAGLAGAAVYALERQYPTGHLPMLIARMLGTLLAYTGLVWILDPARAVSAWNAVRGHA